MGFRYPITLSVHYTAVVERQRAWRIGPIYPRDPPAARRRAVRAAQPLSLPFA
jgi:hypothetical protein